MNCPATNCYIFDDDFITIDNSHLYYRVNFHCWLLHVSFFKRKLLNDFLEFFQSLVSRGNARRKSLFGNDNASVIVSSHVYGKNFVRIFERINTAGVMGS